MNVTAQSVLVVAAHADDEVLGAGGTLAEHVHAGDRVHVLVLSASATSRPGENRDVVRTHRTDCVRQVAALYGAEAEIADFPDNGFDTVPRLKITQTVEDAVRRWRPGIVYTHSITDLSGPPHHCRSNRSCHPATAWLPREHRPGLGGPLRHGVGHRGPVPAHLVPAPEPPGPCFEGTGPKAVHVRVEALAAHPVGQGTAGRRALARHADRMRGSRSVRGCEAHGHGTGLN